MVTQAPTWRKILFPLLFSVLCIVLAIGVFRAFGGTVPFEAEGYRVHVEVPEADALFANSDVRMAGVTVGRVVRVDGGRRSADLLLDIDPQHAPVRRTARAIVRNKSLLGEGYLELAPGPAAAPAIADGGRLGADRVVRAQRFDDVLQTFDPRTRAQLRRMVGGMARAFDGRAGDLNAAIGSVRPLTEDLGTVARSLASQDAELTKLISSSAQVFDAAGRPAGALDAAITQSERLFAVTAQRDDALRRTIAAIPPFVTDLRRASLGIDRATGDIRRAVGSLRPTATLLPPALDALSEGTTQLRGAFADATPVLRGARTSLPPLRRTLDAAPAPLDRVHMASRQLLPFVQLASADRESILANFANVSAATNGQTLLPGGKTAGHLSAWVTVWNTITGGWTKKLPTNRSNPYSKPGPMEKFAKGGLEAYDCRNVDNPLVLPAFGASPPCRTQGPYEFNGKQVYYPRLELPAP